MFDPRSQQIYSTLTSSPTPSNENINHLGIRNLSARVKLSVHNYENYNRANDANLKLRTQNTNIESDVYSPPLWKSTTMIDHENLSPNSRTKVIAKAQWDLMEIARSMPESCYELSLKDIVEKPLVDSPKSDDETRCLFDEKNIEFERKKSVKKVVRQESKKIEKKGERVKNDNFEKGGLFLKMVFPISIRSKGKNNLFVSTNSKRVSPKVETLGKSSSSGRDLSKKRYSGSSGRESAKSGVTKMSGVSSKSATKNDNRLIKRNNVKVSTGCWSFALSTKNKRKSK